MSTFVIRSSTSQTSSYPIVLTRHGGPRSRPNPHLKFVEVPGIEPATSWSVVNLNNNNINNCRRRSPLRARAYQPTTVLWLFIWKKVIFLKYEVHVGNIRNVIQVMLAYSCFREGHKILLKGRRAQGGLARDKFYQGLSTCLGSAVVTTQPELWYRFKSRYPRNIFLQNNNNNNLFALL